MIIEPVNSNKIKVIVDTEEQKEYGITYETMTYSDGNTRKLCEKIVARAKNEIGFSVGNAKLLVEARQGLNGSVTLFLSRIPIAEDRKELLYGQVMRFPSCDAMLDSQIVFDKLAVPVLQRDIYLYDGVYFLYFELFSTRRTAERLLRELLEYSEKTQLSKETLDEHGTLMYSYVA